MALRRRTTEVRLWCPGAEGGARSLIGKAINKRENKVICSETVGSPEATPLSGGRRGRGVRDAGLQGFGGTKTAQRRTGFLRMSPSCIDCRMKRFPTRGRHAQMKGREKKDKSRPTDGEGQGGLANTLEEATPHGAKMRKGGGENRCGAGHGKTRQERGILKVERRGR